MNTLLQYFAYPSYYALSCVVRPFLGLWLRLRCRIDKEDPRRLREKLGHAAFTRPQGELVWIHAASVGEANAILPLLQRLSDEYPKLNILITTVTRTSAELVQRKLPERAFHQFAPLDSPFIIRRFLKHWKPSLAMWVESELWPNMIHQTRRFGCKMLLVNARMSAHSYARWKKLPAVIVRILDQFDRIYPLNERSQEYFRQLGAQDIKSIGNLKYDATVLPADPKASGEIVQMVGGRPRWLAASTHKGEEEMVAQVHRVLKEIHPSLLTMIVPRHRHRGGDIAETLRQKGLIVAQRSRKEPITEETDIYIGDTMGELGIFYRIAGIVLVGGSMIPKGGQNPLEAARLDCALVFGPYMDNFPAIQADFVKENACMIVRDIVQLEEAIEELLYHHEKQEALAEAALKLVESRRGALEALLVELQPYLQSDKKA